MRGILYFQGIFLAILSAFMIAPMVFAIYESSFEVFRAFLLAFSIYVFISGTILFALRGETFELERSQQIVLLVFVWIFIPLLAAVPMAIALEKFTYTDALFETVSAFTTTGATIVVDISSLPKSIILWRSMLSWLGGATTYIVVIMLLKPLFGTEIFGRELHSTGFRTRKKFAHDMESALNVVLPVYLGVTVACFILLSLAGIDKFEALCLSYSAVSTSGFMPHAGNLQTYGRPSVELILAFFMFVGSVSIMWVQSVVYMRWSFVKSVKEPWIVLISIFVLGLFIAYSVLSSGFSKDSMTVGHALSIGIATAASMISTTGMPISKFTEGTVPFVLILTLVIIGGGRFSTAGGVKFYRVGEMMRLSLQELNRLIYPHGVTKNARRNKHQSEILAQSVWTHFSVIILLICVMAVALSVTNIPLTGAFLAAASALSNFGPAYQFADFQVGAKMPTYAEMSAQAKWILCTAMIVGRVEVLAFLALFNIAIWQR